MRGIASIAAVTVCFVFMAGRLGGQQVVAPAWITATVSAPVGASQDLEGRIKPGAESFLNDTCQPAGLDGIQVLSVQTGHNEVFHLHLYCRQDKSSSVRYKVSLISVPDHKVDATAKTLLGKTNVRVGPLYLGANGEADAIVLIEKVE